jgi:hypothetical protein
MSKYQPNIQYRNSQRSGYKLSGNINNRQLQRIVAAKSEIPSGGGYLAKKYLSWPASCETRGEA